MRCSQACGSCGSPQIHRGISLDCIHRSPWTTRRVSYNCVNSITLRALNRRVPDVRQPTMYSKKASCGQDRKLEVLLDCLLLPMEGMPATRRTDSGSAWVGPGLPSCDRRLHSSRSHGESTTSRVWSGGSRGCGAFPPSSWGSSSSSQQQEGIRDRSLIKNISLFFSLTKIPGPHPYPHSWSKGEDRGSSFSDPLNHP